MSILTKSEQREKFNCAESQQREFRKLKRRQSGEKGGKMDILEYMASQPMQEAEPADPEASIIKDRNADIKEADDLKETILKQYESGAEPQMILYNACKCIGLYSDDPEFIEKTTGELNEVWADLMQRSFLQDNMETAMKRLQEKQTEYNNKLRRSIKTHSNRYRNILRELDEIVKKLDEIEILDTDQEE